MPSLKIKLKLFKDSILSKLRKLSFKTGLWILGLCIICYIISFAQMALDLSYTLKGVLWVIFFGLAKTFQYTGLLIIGVEGIKKLKNFYRLQRGTKKEI